MHQGDAHDYRVISSQGIDGASVTDGLEVSAAHLGGPWNKGMLVVKDGRKRMPETTQNFKFVPWSDVAGTLGLECTAVINRKP